MNEKTSVTEVKSNSLLARKPSREEIDSACMYFRHDYGLMGPIERDNLRFMASEWLYSWRKVQEDTERANRAIDGQ